MERFKWLAIGIGILIVFLYHQNNSIMTTRLDIASENLPEDFSGFKVLHLSDLHNKSFGKNQEKLVTLIEKEAPDMIAITGDIIDKRRYDERPSLILLEKITDIAPVYYVTGNHEYWSGKFNTLEKKLNKLEVSVLRSKMLEIKKGNRKINILGIDDYTYFSSLSEYKQALSGMTEGLDKGTFTLLLSHRPEQINTYKSYPVDLVLTGHAHGGQMRLPFVGGLVAPHQGVLPEYTSGIYTVDNLKMIVSRGLGNSLFPQRVFNRPEIVIITLNSF